MTALAGPHDRTWAYSVVQRTALGLALSAALGLASASTVSAQSADAALQGREAAPPVADAARENELDAMTAEIGSKLRCPVCRQQSVTESPAPLALEMQGVIRTMLIDGSTPEQIEAHFVDAYGPWILLRPKAEGASLLIYIGPAIAFLMGGLFLARRMWRLRQTGSGAGPDKAAGADGSEGSSKSDGLTKKDRAWLDAAVGGS